MTHLTLSARQQPRLQHVTVHHRPEYQAVWAQLNYSGRPCMSLELLADLAGAQKQIQALIGAGSGAGGNGGPLYQILSSETPGVFSLGGDLAYFLSCIRTRDRQGLLAYAEACVDILYQSACGYGAGLTTISLVRGEALGGGFEAALASNVLIAEQGARFGFPETMFGMFPGMGAFSFLARRVSPAMARRIIESGKVYTAEDLYQLGVVDRLVPDGEGVRAVCDLITQRRHRTTGFHGLERAIDRFNPLSYEELVDIVHIWVDTALCLSPKNLRLMEYLLRAHQKRWGESEHMAVA